MPYATSNGVRLYFEDTGRNRSGTPILFVHEFSGDYTSWEPQLRHFSRNYRCITFNARGYPPSDVPRSVSKYSQGICVDDARAVLDHLGIRKAHIMGCSMGSQTTLFFGLTHPKMAKTLTLIGIGTGADPSNAKMFRRDTEAKARMLEEGGLAAAFKQVRVAANRVQLKDKNPRAWDDFCKRYMEHSALGCVNITRGVQMHRPALLTLERKLAALKVPTQVFVGDEDQGAVRAGVFIKTVCPAARLAVVPATGHLVNNEEPELLNSLSESFYVQLDTGRWRPRKT